MFWLRYLWFRVKRWLKRNKCSHPHRHIVSIDFGRGPVMFWRCDKCDVTLGGLG